MWHLVGNPENRFSHNEAYLIVTPHIKATNSFACKYGCFPEECSLLMHASYLLLLHMFNISMGGAHWPNG